MTLTEKYTIRQVQIDYQYYERQVRCNVLVQVFNADTLLVQNADDVHLSDAQLQERARIDNQQYWGEPQILAALKDHYKSDNVSYYEPPVEPEPEPEPETTTEL